MHTATLHSLPSCSHERIFELRRAASAAGVRYIPNKPRLVGTKAAPSAPFGGDAA
nr:MAG TPA_asm: hypothetical protein [Caudoviricetes sp.]